MAKLRQNPDLNNIYISRESEREREVNYNESSLQSNQGKEKETTAPRSCKPLSCAVESLYPAQPRGIHELGAVYTISTPAFESKGALIHIYIPQMK